MAPNASPFFNFYSESHAVSFHKNICHQFNYQNNSSILFQNRLKSIKEHFVAVNSNFLKENIFETVGNFSPLSVPGENNENKWLGDLRSITTMRLELIRKILVKQTVKEKLELWQKKKDEVARNVDVSIKPKFQRQEILVEKENYKQILDHIQKRTNSEQIVPFDYEQRCREICFKAFLAKVVLTTNVINNLLCNPQLTLNIDKQIDLYHSMKTKLDILKNNTVVEEESLCAVKILLEDLTLYKNNVVMPMQAKIETITSQIDKKKNPLNNFSVNNPRDFFVKHVRRQYVSLVKSNKTVLNNLSNIQTLPFINDPTTKLFRQNLIKVVNTLVNTISSTNATHMTDKYNKLNALLSGKLVFVANTQVMIGNNKEALAFCMETLASKIVRYAEEVISVKTQAAYEIAAVITKLWSVHQQFGKILFAKIKQICPLLTPFCYPVAKHLVNQQFNHKSFGYKFDLLGNGESNDKYLKRITGIVRLYAVLIVTSTKYNLPAIGLSQAWIFIAGTLNQNPVADITATMLVEFLNIVGFAMHQAYGKQFIKLLQYINVHFLKKIILVTPAGYGGPITRLNSFISKCVSVGSIEEPKGMLSTDFW